MVSARGEGHHYKYTGRGTTILSKIASLFLASIAIMMMHKGIEEIITALLK